MADLHKKVAKAMEAHLQQASFILEGEIGVTRVISKH